MITDFCMSLSRLPQDKINGTGRFFSTGHIEIEDTPREIDESPVAPKQAFANDYSERDKGTLNKFFQNSTNSA